MAENLKLYFHGTSNWFYLQDWMFVDYSLEKLFGGFIFDDMQKNLTFQSLEKTVEAKIFLKRIKKLITQ